MNHLKFQICGQCSLYNPHKQVCMRNGSPMTTEDYCSKYTSAVVTCELCHKPNLPGTLTIVDNHYICANCASLLTTCALCRHSNHCAFEEDPSPIPLTITQQIKMGNQTTVVKTRNPERIRQTCQLNCPCFLADGQCARQFSACCNIDTMPLSEILEQSKSQANFQE